jgi:glucose/arabinose dehydrogenase
MDARLSAGRQKLTFGGAVKTFGIFSLSTMLLLSACGGGPGGLVTGMAGAGGEAGTTPPPDGGGYAGAPDLDGGGDDVNATAATYCERGMSVPAVTPPQGFCVKSYARVREARAIAFAPNGDLFVAAPSRATAGGASGGPGAIIVLSDDDHDGVAESHTFLTKIDATRGIGDVHGLALGGGYLYFTTQTTVWRVAYADGDRVATSTPEDLHLPPTYGTGGRWTHGLALSAKGQLFTSRAAYATCGMQQGGEISTVGADGALTTVASGFRNPMYMRCHPTDEVCAAMELGEDLQSGAREKMLVLRPGTSYGYPCCYTTSKPTSDTSGMTCAEVAQEDASFPLSDTPFGFDWENGQWPAPYTGGIFVALHGSFYSTPQWQGAGIVWAPASATTRAPMQDWQPFVKGFGNGGTVLDRPSDVAFAPDGRMFFSDDQGGYVYWVAPVTMMAPGAAPAPDGSAPDDASTP